MNPAPACQKCGSPMREVGGKGPDRVYTCDFHNPTPAQQSSGVPEPLKPSISLLVKLGSIAVHVEEFFSPHGHPYDKVAAEQLLNDPEVKEWIVAMSAMMPRKRN